MDDLLVGNTTVRPFWAFPELSQECFTSTRPLFSCTPWEQENEYWRRNNAHVPSNGEKKGLFKKQNHLKIRSCNKTLTKDIWPIFYPVYAETYVRLTNNFFFSLQPFQTQLQQVLLQTIAFWIPPSMSVQACLESPVYFERDPSKKITEYLPLQQHLYESSCDN